MFLDVNGEQFRILKQEPQGAWLISFDEPGPPRFVVQQEIDRYCRIPVPDGCIQDTEERRTDAERVRLAMIQPLLDDESCIMDKSVRCRIASESAKAYGTNSRRILRLYYQYLATGVIVKNKPQLRRPTEYADIYKWAINTFYYSAKKPSLRDTYDLMIHQCFVTPDGHLKEKRPTWSSFRHYFYENEFHQRSQKVISREGLTNYQRTARPLLGSAMNWKDHIGAYQMDATLADIYLVSRLDRTKVVGRPYVYLAVDTATQLIAGLYVGFDGDEEAVMACLSNAAMDKVEYCRGHGIEIDAADWPSTGLPSEVITDQGRDFIGGRMQELCMHYGITCETLPPFRPDRKGLVEKMFDLMQNRYKPILRGKGIIEEDAQERWAVDYRAQASLDLTQFTAVLIHCIIYLNGRRVLDNYQMTREMREQDTAPTAAGLWRYYASAGKSGLMEINEQEIYCMSLPRKIGKLTRKGIAHNHFTYINRNFMTSEMGQRYIGQNVSFAFDGQNVQRVYMIFDDGYIPFELAPQFSIYGGTAKAESELYWREDRQHKNDYKRLEEQGRVELLKQLSAIKEGGTSEVREHQCGATIKENRMKERNRRK